MAPLEIQVIKSVSEFEWNHELVKSWARQYASQYAGLMVTDENLKEMEEVRKEIAGKRIKLDEFRKAAKKDFEAPLKQFEAEVKDVQAVLDEVEKPIAEQIQKYEDRRRAEKSKEVQGWIDTMTAAAGLQPGFAAQITVSDKHLLKTATKKSITSDISARIETLLQMQKSEDEAEELRHQKVKMAAQLCAAQSAALGLKIPLSVSDIYGIANIELAALTDHIVTMAVNRKAAERAAEAEENVKNATIADKCVEEPAGDPNPETVQKIEAAKELNAARYTLTMEFLEMTVQEAVWLKEFLDTHNYSYKTISKARVA